MQRSVETGFFAYIGERLSGFEPRPGRNPLDTFRAEIDAFPVSYIGEERLRRDLANLRAAVGDASPDEVFVSAVAPSGVGANEYYPSEAAYLDAMTPPPGRQTGRPRRTGKPYYD